MYKNLFSLKFEEYFIFKNRSILKRNTVSFGKRTSKFTFSSSNITVELTQLRVSVEVPSSIRSTPGWL